MRKFKKQVATVTNETTCGEDYIAVYSTFTPTVNVSAWHILEIQGNSAFLRANPMKWLAWHLPYRISRQWR